MHVSQQLLHDNAFLFFMMSGIAFFPHNLILVRGWVVKKLMKWSVGLPKFNSIFFAIDMEKGTESLYELWFNVRLLRTIRIMLSLLYNDVTWTSWRLKFKATRLCVQQLIQATIEESRKSLHYWPFLRGIPAGNTSNAEGTSMQLRHQGEIPFYICFVVKYLSQ